MTTKAGKPHGGGTSRTKVGAWRARMRARGFRPVQLWVPDTRTEAFRAEARRQARAVAESTQAAADQAFIEAVSEQDEA